MLRLCTEDLAASAEGVSISTSTVHVLEYI